MLLTVCIMERIEKPLINCSFWLSLAGWIRNHFESRNGIIILEKIFSIRLLSKKTVCMVFCPINTLNIIGNSFPNFKLDGSNLNYVTKFKYLGHN